MIEDPVRNCLYCGRLFSLVRHEKKKGRVYRRIENRLYCSPACGGTHAAKERRGPWTVIE